MLTLTFYSIYVSLKRNAQFQPKTYVKNACRPFKFDLITPPEINFEPNDTYAQKSDLYFHEEHIEPKITPIYEEKLGPKILNCLRVFIKLWFPFNNYLLKEIFARSLQEHCYHLNSWS